jgi:beta-glucosidase
MGEDLDLSVTVANTGDLEGDEVVQVYLGHDNASVRTPLCQLVDFKRVTVAAGGTERVNLRIPAKWMRVTFEDGTRHFEESVFTVQVGGSSPGERARELGAAPMAGAAFTLKR